MKIFKIILLFVFLISFDLFSEEIEITVIELHTGLNEVNNNEHEENIEDEDQEEIISDNVILDDIETD